MTGWNDRVVRVEQRDVEVVDAPHLRIISDELWNAVQARVQSQKAPENKGGRPAFYLLSGVLHCGEYNGPLTAVNGKQGNETIKMYTCWVEGNAQQWADREGVALS